MIPFVVLTLINLIAHFVPFERAALSLDDLARIVSSEWSLKFFLSEMCSLDYPLIVFHNLIVMTAGESPFLRVLYVFLSSSLATFMIYLLFKELLEDQAAAFLGAVLYNLLPNKLALYHTLEYTYIHLALTLYFLSFLFFLLFMKREKAAFLWGSVLCYTIAVFWYLLGFFLPGVFLAYTLLFYPKKIWKLWIYAVPAGAYLFWRSDPFGISPADAKPYDLQLYKTVSNLYWMVPNLYAGRQMAKGVLYGLYRFSTHPMPWWPLWAILDAAVLAGFWRWLRGRALPEVSLKLVTIAVVSFFLLVAPALLTWGVMDRHTSLSSLGFVLLMLWGIARWKERQRAILMVLIGAGLVISQGTSWSQVVACRVNRAIFETLQEHKEEIRKANMVLIDQYSFSKKIPYTWIKNPNDQMDTYWGVQGLLGRGNPFLVHWAVGEKKPVEVVRSQLKVSGTEYKISIYNPNTYSLEDTVVPRDDSVLINYDTVYSHGFREGNRVRNPR